MSERMVAPEVILRFKLDLDDDDTILRSLDVNSLCRMELCEELSHSYTANALFYAKNPLSSADLKRLMGLGISFEFGDRRATRFLQGKILQCSFNGIIASYVSNGVSYHTASYTLKVGSDLDFMRRTPKCRAFYKGMNNLHQVTVPQIVKYLLEDNGVTQVDADNKALLDVSYFDEGLIYEQMDESDLDFCLRLCHMYGLNYTFVHDDQGFIPHLFLSRGNLLFCGVPVKEDSAGAGWNDATKTNLDLELKCSLVTGGELDDCLFVDKLTWQDCAAEQTSADPAALGTVFQEGSSGFGLGPLQDTYRLRQNYRNFMSHSGRTYQGHAASIRILPGSVLDFDALYASSSSQDKERMIVVKNTVRVTKAPDESRVNNPDYRLSPALDNTFEALSFNADQILGSYCELRPHSAFHQLRRPVAATVCDAQGEVTDKQGEIAYYAGDLAHAPTMFYARPDLGDGSLGEIVIGTMTVFDAGPEQNCRQEFPRVGQRVLLLPTQGGYYLHSYLKRAVEDLQLADYTSHPGSVLGRWCASAHGAGLTPKAGMEIVEYPSGAADEVGKNQTNRKNIESRTIRQYMLGQGELLKRRRAFASNQKDLKDGYTSVNDTGQSIETLTQLLHQAFREMNDKGVQLTRERLAAFKQSWPESGINRSNGGVTSQDAQQAYDDAVRAYNLAREALENKAEELDNALQLTYQEDKDRQGLTVTYKESPSIVLSLNSEGDVEITAPNGNLNFAAKNIYFTADGEFQVSSKSSTQNADNSSVISASYSSIAVNNSLTLQSRKWTDLANVTGSMLIMDGLAGVTLKAPDIMGIAAYSAMFKDGFGGIMSVNRGTSLVTGSTLLNTTPGKTAAIRNVVNFCNDALTDIESAVNYNTANNSVWSEVINNQKMYVAKGMQAWAQVEKIIQTLGQQNSQSVWEKYITIVLDVMAYMADLAVIMVKINLKPHTDDPQAQQQEQQAMDWLSFSSDLLKTGSALTSLIPLYLKTIAAGKSAGVLMKLDPQKLFVKANNVSVMATEYQNNSALVMAKAEIKKSTDALKDDLNARIDTETGQISERVNELDADYDELITDMLSSLFSLIGDEAADALVNAALGEAEKLTTTNSHKQGMAGTENVMPTESTTVLDRQEATGNENKGNLASDNVSAQEGNVKASNTDVNADNNQAEALKTGADAVDTEAGATEVATKALKMN